jgi:hypothetical protein
MVLKLRHFGKEIINTWKHLKCDAGEECKLIRTIVRQMKKY